jgi:hypothetical protein
MRATAAPFSSLPMAGSLALWPNSTAKGAEPASRSAEKPGRVPRGREKRKPGISARSGNARFLLPQYRRSGFAD